MRLYPSYSIDRWAEVGLLLWEALSLSVRYSPDPLAHRTLTSFPVIFGEIIPQSVCVRYGLPIGAWMSPLVLVLMWVLAPVAWPTALLLDKLLGEDHGTTYKKAGLKTLVTLHKSLGDAGEQLNQDEVTIISAVLDLKAKAVGDIMTPMQDVFTMSADTVLDEATMETILGAGYSRIPIYSPENPDNFVGMLLIKILITYDPEDGKRVRDFALATLPETRAETSCLDIVNFFQEGKSHMVLVSEYPGDDHGALGVVTLEDVIEELIGEEIIDESDVFIDVHKAIRRLAPAPKSRVPRGKVVTEPDDTIAENQEALIDVEQEDKETHPPRSLTTAVDGHINGELATSPTKAKPYFRRASSIANVSDREGSKPRQMTPEMREHLKHLGPSNLASRPRSTRYNTVKIKPGSGSFVDGVRSESHDNISRKNSTAAQGGVGAGLVSSAGKDASDGVLAVHAGYGTVPAASPPGSRKSKNSNIMAKAAEETRQARLGADENFGSRSRHRSRANSHSTLGSMDDGIRSPTSTSRHGVARSGSITEQIIEAGGIRKTVLELTSSSDEPEPSGATQSQTKKSKANTASDANNSEEDGGGVGVSGDGAEEEGESKERGGSGGRKKRRRRKRKPGAAGGTAGESAPLLGNDR